MKYIIELEKTPRMANINQKLYLKWARHGITHIVTDKKEATRYTKKQINKLKMIIDEKRMIVHKEEKNGKQIRKNK